MTIEIQHNSAAILDAFNQLLERSQAMEPVMRALSGVMTGAVEDAFEQQKAPDGTPWASLSEDTTIPRRKAKNHWPGQTLQDSGQLAASVHSEYGDDYATVGTNKPYAAMMQFGGKKADFPHLWGDIPARPFLGLSAGDEDEIIGILQDFLTLSP